MARSIGEIVLRTTKPETEWLMGRAVRKLSPFRRHAVVQSATARLLAAWAIDRGQVGTEWRFRLMPPGEVRRPLVPDVAFLSYERLRPLDAPDRESPPIAPDIAVEIRSPSDRAVYLAHKRAVYFATGSSLFIIIDPAGRRLAVDDVDGTTAVFGGTDVVFIARYPDLVLPLADIFAELDVPD